MIMSERHAVKIISSFAKREFYQKRPISARVLRLKGKNVLSRGLLPNLSIKEFPGIRFLVVLDYSDIFRIYYFDKTGKIVGGKNHEKTESFARRLDKNTKVLYSLPKKGP